MLLILSSTLLIAVSSVVADTAIAHRPPYTTAATSKSTRATAQTLDCYDYVNYGGDRVSAIDYIPALSGYSFDNRISSCCFTGVWILYANEDYNDASPGAANWWAYGNNYCTNVPTQFDDQASSLRFTGAPDGWEYDVLNLYFRDFFIGGEEFLYSDQSQLNYDNAAQSLIVTGCSPWTIYQYSNFQGTSMCVYPANMNLCYPGFYTTAASLGSLAGQISSARRGCFSKNSRFPDNYVKVDPKEQQVQGSGASGFFRTRSSNNV